MKFSNIFLAVLGCFLWTAAAWAQNTIPYRFATRAEAQMLITDIDEYTNSLNQFDVEVRLQKKDGRKSQFLTLAMNETQNWSDQDREKVNKAMKAISDQIQKQKFTLHFPKEIILLKTSMKEEGNRSGYARKNWIALGENLLSGASEDSLQQMLTHELFHILTRSDLVFKRAMYKTIGFTVLNREILFPADVIEKRISDPDINRYDNYATFTIDGSKRNCAMIMYTSRPYESGSLNEYVCVGLIPLNNQFVPVQMNGETVIYPLDKATDLYTQIGKNTRNVTNPEEILADNFSYVILNKTEVPTPEILDNIRKVLKRK